MSLISDKDRDYLKEAFSRMVNTARIVLFTQDFECASCRSTHELMNEVAELSDKIDLVVYDLVDDAANAKEYSVDRVPAVVVEGDEDYGIRFYGIPSGYEFSTLVEDIISVGTGELGLSGATADKLRDLEQDVRIQVFVTPGCPYCRNAVHTAHMMAMASPRVTSEMVMANEFPHLANRYGVMAVPKVVINDSTSFEGAIPEEDFLSFVLRAVAS